MKSTNAKLKDWFSAWDADQIIGWMDRRKAHRKSRWVRKLNRMLDRYEEEEKRSQANEDTNKGKTDKGSMETDSVQTSRLLSDKKRDERMDQHKQPSSEKTKKESESAGKST